SNRLLLGIAREPDPRRQPTECGYRVGFRSRHEEDGAVPRVPNERVDEQLQAERERERLVRLLSAERDELVLLREPRDDVAPGDPRVAVPLLPAALGSIEVRPQLLRVGLPEAESAQPTQALFSVHVTSRRRWPRPPLHRPRRRWERCADEHAGRRGR